MSEDAVVQADTDARKEHERALARERQRRRRSRKSHGVTMLNGHAVTPGAKRLMAVAQAVAQGTPMQTALRNQGFPESSQSVKTQAHDLLRASLLAGAVTVDKVVRSTRESLDATSPMLTSDGCIEKPDWAARATGRRDAIALLDRAGELPQLQQATGHGHVTLTFNSLNVTLPDVVVQDAVDESVSCKVLNSLESMPASHVDNSHYVNQRIVRSSTGQAENEQDASEK